MTIPVIDGLGNIVSINEPSSPGRAAAADSKPVVLSTEDLASIVSGIVLATGSNIIGRVGIDQSSPGVSNGIADASLTPKGVAVVTVTGTAQSLAQLLTAGSQLGGSVPTGSRVVYIQPRGGDIRFSDAASPTTGASGVGIDVYDRTAWPYYGTMASIKFIASANTTCNLAFYG